MKSRSDIVALAASWIGKKESDGSHKTIIDIYNEFVSKHPELKLAKMSYTSPWCACTWSALAIKMGYTDIIPIEISCGRLIEKAKMMGCWVENDGYIPDPGDGILYDWDDSGKGDNTGWPDHVGMIEYVNVSSGYMVIIEGNYSNSVKKRTISINGKYIRGFITPKYVDNSWPYAVIAGVNKDINVVAREVIAGQWGSGSKRKEALERAGFNYAKVQKKVNEILNRNAEKTPTSSNVETTCIARSKYSNLSGTYTTTANVYCRNDAGNNKKALCLIPKGTKVQNYGFYTEFKGVKWLLIQFTLNGVKYTGFTSSQYLKK